MRKSLQRLEKENLLHSKHYGLGKEKLWQLAKHPVIEKLGYTPPKNEIHGLFYDHELIAGDLFVALARTGYLLDWQSETQLNKFRPDCMAMLSDQPIYFEIERGNQNRAKLIKKVQNYFNYFRETRQMFHTIFVVPDDLHDQILDIFRELNAPPAYGVTRINPFIGDVLNAEILSRSSSLTLSHLLPGEETD